MAKRHFALFLVPVQVLQKRLGPQTKTTKKAQKSAETNKSNNPQLQIHRRKKEKRRQKKKKKRETQKAQRISTELTCNCGVSSKVAPSTWHTAGDHAPGRSSQTAAASALGLELLGAGQNQWDPMRHPFWSFLVGNWVREYDPKVIRELGRRFFFRIAVWTCFPLKPNKKRGIPTQTEAHPC